MNIRVVPGSGVGVAFIVEKTRGNKLKILCEEMICIGCGRCYGYKCRKKIRKRSIGDVVIKYGIELVKWWQLMWMYKRWMIVLNEVVKVINPMYSYGNVGQRRRKINSILFIYIFSFISIIYRTLIIQRK